MSREVIGWCLDIGCGRGNRFIKEHLDGRGVGIDVYPYEGLDEGNLVEDPTHLPFPDGSFDTVTFIANLNHIPESDRDDELREAYRVLRRGGNVVVTMGNPVAEIVVHKVVSMYDRLLGTRLDVDSERGMGEEEQYFLLDREITGRLGRTGFVGIERKGFATQWWLNHLFVGWKGRRES